jgi:hypothetical protein
VLLAVVPPSIFLAGRRRRVLRTPWRHEVVALLGARATGTVIIPGRWRNYLLVRVLLRCSPEAVPPTSR